MFEGHVGGFACTGSSPVLGTKMKTNKMG